MDLGTIENNTVSINEGRQIVVLTRNANITFVTETGTVHTDPNNSFECFSFKATDTRSLQIEYDSNGEQGQIIKIQHTKDTITAETVILIQFISQIIEWMVYVVSGIFFVIIYLLLRKTNLSIQIALYGLYEFFTYIAFIMWNPAVARYMNPVFINTEFISQIAYAISAVLLIMMAIGFLTPKQKKFKIIAYTVFAATITNVVIQLCNSGLKNNIKLSSISNAMSFAIFLCAACGLIHKNKKKKIILTILSVFVGGGILLMEYASPEISVFRDYTRVIFDIASTTTSILLALFIAKNIKITNKKEEQHELEITDAMTGLKNNKCLADIISKKDDEEYSKTEDISVIQFDINDTQKRNAAFGHEEGDKIIKDVDQMIFEAFGNAGTCIRQGDEFIVIINAPNAEKKCVNGTDIFAQLLNEYNQALPAEQKVTVAQGGAIGKRANIQKLLESAYKSMLNTKQQMKSPDYIKDNSTYKIIKHAILHESVEPYFQPIRDNETGKFNKFEALMRINYDGRVCPPGMFMEYVKHSNQYFLVSAQMLQKTFDAFRDLDATVSMNISSRDIANETISTLIIENLKKPHKNKVILELLETEEFDNMSSIIEFVNKSKSLGALIAIDDYGSGYSNLKLIAQVKPNFIKIDGEIVKNIEHDDIMVSIINYIVKIAENMGAEVVAEYVENEAIQNIIVSSGVRYSQGYYFSKPIQLEEAKKFL